MRLRLRRVVAAAVQIILAVALPLLGRSTHTSPAAVSAQVGGQRLPIVPIMPVLLVLLVPPLGLGAC